MWTSDCVWTSECGGCVSVWTSECEWVYECEYGRVNVSGCEQTRVGVSV